MQPSHVLALHSREKRATARTLTGSPLNEIKKAFGINGDMSSAVFFQDIRAITIHTATQSVLYMRTVSRSETGAGTGAEEGYEHGYGYGYGDGDVDEDVVQDEQELNQAEKSADESKGTLDTTPSFYLVLRL